MNSSIARSKRYRIMVCQKAELMEEGESATFIRHCYVPFLYPSERMEIINIQTIPNIYDTFYYTLDKAIFNR